MVSEFFYRTLGITFKGQGMEFIDLGRLSGKTSLQIYLGSISPTSFSQTILHYFFKQQDLFCEVPLLQNEGLFFPFWGGSQFWNFLRMNSKNWKKESPLFKRASFLDRLNLCFEIRTNKVQAAITFLFCWNPVSFLRNPFLNLFECWILKTKFEFFVGSAQYLV